MHALFARLNKKKDDSKENTRDLCPYKHRPRCGMFISDIQEGEQPDTFPPPIPCTRITVDAKADDEFVVFHQKMNFVWGGKTLPIQGRASVLIPVSEFGKLDQFECKINGTKVQGDVLRRAWDEDDSFFINARRPGGASDLRKNKNKSSTTTSATAAASGGGGGGGAGDEKKKDTKKKKDSDNDVEKLSEEAKQKREQSIAAASNPKNLHDVFYFCARNLPEQLRPNSSEEPVFKQGTLFEVEIIVKVGILKDSRGRFTTLYPLTAAPKLAIQEFTLHYAMSRSIRQIQCLNKGPIIHTALRGRRAKVVIESLANTERSFKKTDHLFGFAVELGEPIVPQCADPVAIFVLITFIGSMIFFTLTQNLMDDTF